MSWEEQPTVEAPTAELAADNGAPAAADTGGAPRSSLEAIRARRAQLAERKTLDLLVPGYEGQLAVRYRPVLDEEFDALIARIQGGQDGNVDAACDLLIRSCETVLVAGEDGQLEALADDAGVPLRFDTRLADLLGFQAETARAVVRGVFSPEGTAPLAPGPHAAALLEWLQGNEGAVDRSLLGE